MKTYQHFSASYILLAPCDTDWRYRSLADPPGFRSQFLPNSPAAPWPVPPPGIPVFTHSDRPLPFFFRDAGMPGPTPQFFPFPNLSISHFHARSPLQKIPPRYSVGRRLSSPWHLVISSHIQPQAYFHNHLLIVRHPHHYRRTWVTVHLCPSCPISASSPVLGSSTVNICWVTGTKKDLSQVQVSGWKWSFLSDLWTWKRRWEAAAMDLQTDGRVPQWQRLRAESVRVGHEARTWTTHALPMKNCNAFLQLLRSNNA